jgi:hypothetical protein
MEYRNEVVAALLIPVGIVWELSLRVLEKLGIKERGVMHG